METKVQGGEKEGGEKNMEKGERGKEGKESKGSKDYRERRILQKEDDGSWRLI
jgi:hypothetical protein